MGQGARGRSQPFLDPPGPKFLLTGSQRSGRAVWTRSRCLVSLSPSSQAFPPQPSLNPTTGPGRRLPWFLCWTLCPALSQLSPGRRGETFHLYSLDWLQSRPQGSQHRGEARPGHQHQRHPRCHWPGPRVDWALSLPGPGRSSTQAVLLLSVRQPSTWDVLLTVIPAWLTPPHRSGVLCVILTD